MFVFLNRAPVKCLFALLFFICVGPRADADAQLDAERIREIATYLPPRPAGLGPPAANRKKWDEVAALPVFQNWLNASRPSLLEPLPKISDELYLDYSRTGKRDDWQNVAFARRVRMASLGFAECLEYKGAFLAPLEQAIKEICAERTWIYPAHDRGQSNFNGLATNIDLGSSWVALELATIDSLLADKLSPPVRTLIRDNLQRRIFQPYRDMVEGRRPEDSWLRRGNNWNAVCLAGVTGSALAVLDSREDRAWFIAASQHYIRYFINGFTSDGYCSEGVSYWNYGFGHFVLLTETVRQATANRVDFLADPTTHNPALFSRRIEILNGIYPSIADCHPGAQPDLAIATYLCRRFHLTPCAEDNAVFHSVGSRLFMTVLWAFLPEELPRIPSQVAGIESPLRSWFPEGGVLISRATASAKIPFAVSLKGGNNAEQHNHNDLGSFIVVVGGSTVLTDPGSEVYTARTFSSRRYDSDVLNSFGHSVPVIAGQLQRAGSSAKAVVARTEFTDARDVLSLDLKSAYAVPTLKQLERTFVFQRAAASFTVRDDAEFSKAELFETALVTRGEWKQVSTNEFLVTEGKDAARVKIDTGGRPYLIHLTPLNDDPRKKATRIGVALKEPITKASVVLTITP